MIYLVLIVLIGVHSGVGFGSYVVCLFCVCFVIAICGL